MKKTVHQLVRALFSKDSIEELELQEIQSLARQYPYFTPLQLILAEKMKPGHPGAYEKQLQKTSLYFHDPLLFDFVLNEEDYEQRELIVKEPVRKEHIEEEVEVIQTENPVETKQEFQPVQEEYINRPEVEIPEETDIEEAELTQEPLPERGQFRELSIKPVSESDNVLTFEPYHTVDYFASQGIRLQTEDKPDDNFGRQLKSFTEWLKAMKKLPEAEISKNLDSGSESSVKSLAEHSLEETKVETEAMAEVWEKQGNYEKALAVYEKLSLSNPSKSAYFAAKIEQLKKEI